MMRKTSSGKLTRTRRSSLDASSGGRNCGVQARAEEKEKAAEDALSPVEKVLTTPPKTMTTTPASMEKEKERINGRVERTKPTLPRAKARARTRARVRENPSPKAVSPSKLKARPRSLPKLKQQTHLPQRIGVGTQKKIGHRGKKVHILRRTIKTNAEESPKEAKTRKSYVSTEEPQMDQCTQNRIQTTILNT